MKTVRPNPAGIESAVEALRRGEVIAYPTETVYGLGVDPWNEEALERLYSIKGRTKDSPLLLIVAGAHQLDRVAPVRSDRAEAYISRFWPGPLSLLLNGATDLSTHLIGPGHKVCVRCPGLDLCRDLCEAFGGAIVSTSANRSGKPPARTLPDAMLEYVELGIDGGELSPSLPSTVFDPDSGLIIRAGAIPASSLETPDK